MKLKKTLDYLYEQKFSIKEKINYIEKLLRQPRSPGEDFSLVKKEISILMGTIKMLDETIVLLLKENENEV